MNPEPENTAEQPNDNAALQPTTAPNPTPAPAPIPPPLITTSIPEPLSGLPLYRKIPQNLLTALAILGITGAALLVLLPFSIRSISEQTDTPAFITFVVAGLIGIVITAVAFAQISKLGLGFSKTALALGLGYNALIAIVKLGLAPAALYLANQESSFNTDSGDANSPFYYLALGLVIMLLYAIALKLLYRHFRKRFRNHTGITEYATSKPKFHISPRGWLIAVGLIFLLIVTGYGLIFLLFLPLVFSPLSYLGYIFSAAGITVATALGVALFLAYRTFAEVERQAVQVRDATILASFFWIALSLILLYHMLWVVFMIVLISIWPFNTYTPK